MKKIVASVLLVISIIFLFKGFTDWKYRISNKVNNNSIRELATSKNEEEPLNRFIDFQKLKSINKDVVAWIYIPGTKVDYPILVGESDEEYLYKNINKEYTPLALYLALMVQTLQRVIHLYSDIIWLAVKCLVNLENTYLQVF
ncbi:hypothetical protein [uncultured Clostridium sp.]|uniref:hypothetical protein n=1 Tax=uncultured Clostridium sp. TaxID=59620 RepID=UPI0025FB288F|nr:hypothetical protein [uncultured Clostridium sp.]